MQNHAAGTITTNGHHDQSVSRRKFLRIALLATVGGALTQALGGFLGFFWPKQVGAFGSKIDAGLASDFPLNGVPIANREGKFFIAHVDDGLLALYRKCTHLGCTVPEYNTSEDQFHCPCHGSLFNKRGEVTGGPAPRPMDLMEIEVVNGRVIVNTGKIIQRAEWQPDQATKL